MDQQKKDQFPSGTRHLYLIFAVGVPGIGKSYLITKFKDFCLGIPDNSVNVCISDEVRSKTLAQYYLDNGIKVQELSQEEIYKIEEINVSNTRNALMEDIKSKIEAGYKSQATHNFFIIDKNNSSKTLIKYIEEVSEPLFEGQRIHRAVLVPDSFNNKEQNLCHPFNFDIMLIGLIRSLLRKEHMTMKFGSVHSLLSFIGCVQGQIKEPFESRFPEERFSMVTLSYYNPQVMDEGKHDPKHRQEYQELESIITDLSHGKTTVTEQAPKVVELVTKLNSLNSFANLSEDVYKDIYLRVLESK